MKMNKKQYNNIINHSLQYDCKDSENPLDTARIIFNNMGVALPQGTIKEVYDTVSTGEYMGWKKCTLEEAKEAANNGIAAMGISENKIVVLSAEDDEQPAQQTASVLTLTDNTPAVAVANLQYYSYSYGSTTGGSTTTPWRKAIIIIPGIMGTELIAGPNNTDYSYGTKLWSDSLLKDFEGGILEKIDVVNRVISLRCNSNGESNNDIIPFNNLYGFDDTYKKLFDTLSSSYGNDYSINFFAYDWRLSNAINANKLDSFINSYCYDEVVLVCHSMGGLVASGYLSLGFEQRNKVKSVITLGSPLLGVPIVPYLWGSEDVEALFGDFNIGAVGKWLIEQVELYFNPLDYLMGNFASMYEMFPSAKYFDEAYTDKTYLITSFVGGAPLEIQTYAETRARLDSYLSHFNKKLADASEDFHDSLYTNSIHITGLVNTYYVAGYNAQTIDKIEFNMWNWYVDSYIDEGDSVVSAGSATLGDKYPSKTFYVKNVNHMGLVQDSQTCHFISQLISENTSTSSYSKIYNNLN